MKAIYFDGAGFTLKEIPVPDPPPGEALIRVKAAGICSTDIEIGRGYMDFRGVPGHEFVGVAEKTGDPGLSGRRVVGEINCPCGVCDLCARGLGRHCRYRKVLGIYRKNGCFAEYVTLPEGNLHRVPESMTDLQAIMVEPTAAAFRILEELGDVSGLNVAVLGDGRLGLLTVQVLASAGARVSLIGKHPERRAIIEGRGVEFLLAKARETSDLQGSFRVAVDCTGSPHGAADAIELLEPTGKLVVKTTVREPLPLPSERLVVDEITVIGSRCGPFDRAIQALCSGSVKVDDMIEGSYSLPEFESAISRASGAGALKIVLTIT